MIDLTAAERELLKEALIIISSYKTIMEFNDNAFVGKAEEAVALAEERYDNLLTIVNVQELIEKLAI